ncbi:MAG TPA: hypothetical protein PLS49_02365 [Candidatus Woesebacteria bacterium]|nr:hypothetical protein [Candidatus Woesebacteria bacterium]
MFKLFKKFNEIFIQLILIIFYFSIIGLARLIHLFSKRRETFSNSYWEKPSIKSLDITSPY